MARALVDTKSKDITIKILNPNPTMQKLHKDMVVADFEQVVEIKNIETSIPKGSCNAVIPRDIEKESCRPNDNIGNINNRQELYSALHQSQSLNRNDENRPRNELGDDKNRPSGEMDDQDGTNIPEDNVNNRPIEIPEHLKELYEKSSIDLGDNDKNELAKILMKRSKLFAKDKHDLGRTDVIQHRINTGNAAPIRQAPRRIPIHQRETEREQVQMLLDNGLIEESTSPWASNCVLVLKKDKKSWRYCLDFRALNAVTVPEAYPLPRIDDTLDKLSGSDRFTVLDLQAGYWQILVRKEDREKLAVNTSLGLMQFRVMPMGCVSATATFSRCMDKVLRGLTNKQCLTYLDDILIFSSGLEQAFERLDTVLGRLEEAGLKLNPSKCNLLQKEVEYLGHIVSEKGVATDPAKLEAVSAWPTPTNITELRSFLGTCSYYRKYIKGFSHIARPLHKLTEKNRVYSWCDEAEQAFQALKCKLTESPILAYPNDIDDYLRLRCKWYGCWSCVIPSPKRSRKSNLLFQQNTQ